MSSSKINDSAANRDQSLAELKRLYDAAQTQYERRTVALRAIDAGTIQRGQPLSTIDAIFGSHFASNLPLEKNATQFDRIYFGLRMGGAPRPDGQKVAFGYFGWSMKVVYDHEGTIQTYELSNLWKEHSSYERSQQPTPITELRRLYESAHSEDERRAVCLRAIDEGVITTVLDVATIDGIFGTHFASNLPTKKDGKRLATVDFSASPAPAPKTDDGKLKGDNSTAWFLALEYDNKGNIEDYYLTNVHK